jgi:hypothetical protein
VELRLECFAQEQITNDAGFADIDWFRIEKVE